MRALIRPPFLFRRLYPGALWRMNIKEKIIYLTFDDGPVPGVTPAALAVLKQFGVKATFFCVGNNVKKHPEIFQQIIAEGHTIGNHTFDHLDGWNVNSNVYLKNIQECAELVLSKLFRPPYGRMRPKQRKSISRHYKIVLWDVLAYDFEQQLTGEECLQIALNYSREGSIVVFHDSEKAKERMLYALPKFIEEMKAKGFQFSAL